MCYLTSFVMITLPEFVGSTTISLGLSKPSQISKVRIVPSVLETSIRFVPASVQYNLLVTQSNARPAGETEMNYNKINAELLST